MDIFEKCYAPSLAGELKEKGVYPYFHALQSRQDVEVTMEGKRRIMLGSNNYLGLTIQPEVVEAGVKALEQYGTGCSGSRFLNGTLELHLELEAELAKFLRKDGIVTFGTGFQSNVGIISALVDRHDYVICDKENHASIYAGCQMSYGKMLRYRHNDMGELERFLRSPIAEELRGAETLLREYRFTVLLPALALSEDAAAEDHVLLQGIVDCCFGGKDGPLTVLDFKTDRVKGEELRLRAERYRPQLEAYSGALSRVLERPVERRILCFLHAGETVEL